MPWSLARSYGSASPVGAARWRRCDGRRGSSAATPAVVLATIGHLARIVTRMVTGKSPVSHTTLVAEVSMCPAKPFAGQGADWQIRDVDAELARNEADLLDPRRVLFFNRLLFHGTPSHATLGAEACPAWCLRSLPSFSDHSGGSLCGLWQRGQGHHPLVFVQDCQEDDAGTAR